MLHPDEGRFQGMKSHLNYVSYEIDHSKLRRWLSPPGNIHAGEYYRDDYTIAQRVKIPGTCQWLSENLAFRSWLEDVNNENLLWIFGVAGSGKTILTTSAIDFIQKAHPYSILLYFFCNRNTNDEHKNNSLSVIRSLLFQLWISTKDDEQFRECWVEVFNSVDLECTQYLPHYVEALERVLALAQDIVFIVIDAVDECDGRDQWMCELLSVIDAKSESPRSPGIKVLLTSRPEPYLRRISERFSTIELTPQTTAVDLRRVVYNGVEEGLKDGSIVVAKESLKNEIITKLIKGAQGM